jgi:hypothetical protein
MRVIGDALKIFFMLVAGHNQSEVYESVTGDRPVADHIPTAEEIVAR